MIRTVLRTFGLLASLASFMTFLTVRGPSGEPSALERVPVLMGALKARLAAKDRLAATPTPAPLATEPAPVIPPAGVEEFAPSPEEMPPSAPEILRPSRLPSGTAAVKVNRGLP